MEDTKMNAIMWSEAYTLGFTDSFCFNEVIVAGLSAADVSPLLNRPSHWPTYYSNSANTRIHDGKGPELQKGTCFVFETFGFPVESQCSECVPPTVDKPGRIPWKGYTGQDEDRLDVVHAWLVEDLDGVRVRILTQESQKGEPAKDLAENKPNTMINGRQEWLNGLVAAARTQKQQ